MFFKGLGNLVRTRKLPRLLPRWKATVGAELNMLWQRWYEDNMMKRLQMMNRIKRRAEFHVQYEWKAFRFIRSVVVAFFGKSTSFRAIVFSRVISFRKNCWS